jgi:hypothetical protein
VESLDDVLDFPKRPEIAVPYDEFIWLAIGLYTSAGFEAHTIMVPNRELVRFSPQLVSPAFLSDEAIAVKVGDTWRFTSPHNAVPLPFGMLSWTQEGQVGLLALDHQQEFLKVPVTTSDKSVITSSGEFTLDAAGTLSGECSRSFTGQTAVQLRGQLRKANPQQRNRTARKNLGVDTDIVEVTRVRVTGFDDPEAPIVVYAHLRWPSYAVRTKDRRGPPSRRLSGRSDFAVHGDAAPLPGEFSVPLERDRSRHDQNARWLRS